MHIDYKNLIGGGHSAMYMTNPRHHFYLKISHSLFAWIQNFNTLKARGLFKTNRPDGIVSSQLDLAALFSDFISSNLYSHQEQASVYQTSIIPQTVQNPEFPFASCTVSHGISICAQLEIDFLRSNIVELLDSTADPTVSQNAFVWNLSLEFIALSSLQSQKFVLKEMALLIQLPNGKQETILFNAGGRRAIVVERSGDEAAALGVSFQSNLIDVPMGGVLTFHRMVTGSAAEATPEAETKNLQTEVKEEAKEEGEAKSEVGEKKSSCSSIDDENDWLLDFKGELNEAPVDEVVAEVVKVKLNPLRLSLSAGQTLVENPLYLEYYGDGHSSRLD